MSDTARDAARQITFAGIEPLLGDFVFPEGAVRRLERGQHAVTEWILNWSSNILLSICPHPVVAIVGVLQILDLLPGPFLTALLVIPDNAG